MIGEVGEDKRRDDSVDRWDVSGILKRALPASHIGGRSVRVVMSVYSDNQPGRSAQSAKPGFYL